MRVEIDIHGLTEQMAVKTLEKFIVACDKSVTEIVVIHGYHKGSALKDMVRNPNKLRSKKYGALVNVYRKLAPLEP